MDGTKLRLRATGVWLSPEPLAKSPAYVASTARGGIYLALVRIQKRIGLFVAYA